MYPETGTLPLNSHVSEQERWLRAAAPLVENRVDNVVVSMDLYVFLCFRRFEAHKSPRNVRSRRLVLHNTFQRRHL